MVVVLKICYISHVLQVHNLQVFFLSDYASLKKKPVQGKPLLQVAVFQSKPLLEVAVFQNKPLH